MEFLVGFLTLCLPLWFAFFDSRYFPRLRWTGEGGTTPSWGHGVVVAGVILPGLIGMAAPMEGFHPAH